MQRTLLALMILLSLFGCDNKGKNDDQETFIEQNSEIPLLQYKFDDISGFELNPDIEELYTKKQIDFGHNCILSLDNGNLKFRCTDNTPIEIREKVAEIYNGLVGKDILGTIGVKIKTNNEQQVYIGGIKNNKLWFGLFDEKTKKKITEWVDTKEIERIISINTGYGEYTDFNIKYLQSTSHIQTTNGLCLLLYPSNHKVVFINNNKITSSSLAPRYNNYLNNWYNNSILVKSEKEPYKIDYFVFKENGELITSFYSDLIRAYTLGCWYPCSYTEQIGIGVNSYWGSLQKIDLSANYINNNKETIWSTKITPFQIFTSFSVNMTSKLISVNNNLWEMEYEGAEISGDKIKTHFTVNIDNGNIEYHK